MGNEQSAPGVGDNAAIPAGNSLLEPEFEAAESIAAVLPKSADELRRLESFLDEKCSRLRGEISRLALNDNRGFMEVYRRVNVGHNHPAEASVDPSNRRLNRYNNIVAYDHSRVKVQPTKYTGNSDYLNANYIAGAASQKQYIAAQGPVPDSFAAHWQSIWENKVDVIAMVTNELENGKLKCHRYWPNAKEKSVTHGDIKITLLSEEPGTVYVLRKFTVTRSGETRSLVQLAFTSWPDHGVPSTTKELLQFRKAVRDAQAVGTGKGPLFIHCSAGVGRTGTYIGLDIFLERCLKLDGNLDIADMVIEMRNSRNFMVQSLLQFGFLYNVCLDGAERLLRKIRRELRLAGMTQEDRNQALLNEIHDQVAYAEEQRDEFIRKADARHDDGKPTDDVHLARKVSTKARRASLMSASEWTGPGNDPQSDPSLARAAKLQDRLHALQDTQKEFAQNLEDAMGRWQVETESGDSYNVLETLTPLESRLQSLSAAESSWKQNSDGFRSKTEEELRQNLNALSARLESLQSSMIRPAARQASVHDEVARLSTLTERLTALRSDEEAWIKRGNIPRYDFQSEVSANRSAEEEKRRQLEEKEKRAQEEAQARARAEAEEAERRRKAEAEQKAEEERRAAAKSRIFGRAKSSSKEFDPEKERTSRHEKEMAAEAERKRKEEEKLQAQRDKEEKAAAKRRSSEDAAKKANKFLSKLRK
eukprot:m.288241 g.288241  ORF g.288241 m.288241 type:complete len:705 (+) comp11933_c0_seq1:3-2117(+)